MAIITETYELNGRQYVRTFSDAGRYVVGGVPYGEYSEANDPAAFGRTYAEGELMPVGETVLAEKAAAYDILVGVSE